MLKNCKAGKKLADQTIKNQMDKILNKFYFKKKSKTTMNTKKNLINK